MKRALLVLVIGLSSSCSGVPYEVTDGKDVTPAQPRPTACASSKRCKLGQCEYEFSSASCKQRVGNGSMPGLPLSCKGVFLF